MKTKKSVGFLLSLLLIFSGIVPVYGANDESKGMEDAILAVKNVVQIPASHTEFRYELVKGSEENQEANFWRFNWNNKDGKGSISATVDENNLLVSYNQFLSVEKQGVSKLTYEDGKKTSLAFLGKANPMLSKEMKLVEGTNRGNVNAYTYDFVLYKNEIPVDFVRANLVVDKFTNQVSAFDFQGDTKFNGIVPDKAGVLDSKTAQNLYRTNGGMELNYFSYYDQQVAKLYARPVYTIPNTQKAIDAKTGQPLTVYKKNQVAYRDQGRIESANKESASGSVLTKEEYAGVEKVNALLSADKARGIAKDYASSIGHAFTFSTSSLNENSIEKGKFYWTFYSEDGMVNVDAKTGELIYFFAYKENQNNGKIIDEKTAQAEGEKFIKSVADEEKWKQVKKVENPAQPQPYEDAKPETYTFTYNRQVNGVSFDSNYFSVIVNAHTGKVMGYTNTWYDQVTFPGIEKAIAPEKAFDIFNETGKLQLMYVQDEKEQVVLAYQFENPVRFYVAADNDYGLKLGYDGKEYTENAIPTYTDIRGHWCEDTVNILTQNGYYYTESTQFMPNDKIRQDVFLRFLYAPVQTNYDQAEFYEMLDERGILLYSEQAPGKNMTRQEAAKITIRYLGQEKAASYTNIYKNMFKDTVEKEYIGYAALSNAFGIVKGDTKGRFLGTKEMTNGEAATVILRTLEANR